MEELYWFPRLLLHMFSMKSGLIFGSCTDPRVPIPVKQLKQAFFELKYFVVLLVKT